jgi:VWFA-related protein
MRTPPVAAVLAAMVVCVVAAAPGQQVFRSRSDIVSLFATVTDAADGFVDALPQDAFEVYDNGKRQPLALFSREAQPISVVVLLDRSGSMADDAKLVSEAASEFVKRLEPNDRARIGNFANEIHIEPADFTGDQKTLTGILQAPLPELGASPIWTATDRAVTALLHEPGRRVILLMTDGHDNPLAGQVHTDVKDVVYRAEFDEVMLYTIGVTTEGMVRTFSVHRGRNGSVFSAQPEPPDPNLKLLADESGGRYFLLGPDVALGTLFARIADELHHQYWLGIKPGKLDEKVHKLEVRVTRPGLIVRARKSYVAR